MTDDHIGDRIEHELNVRSVGGTSEMCVNFFLWIFGGQIFEFHFNVGGRFFIRVRSTIFREADVQRGAFDFGFKQILFVQKQNHRCVVKELVVTDAFEQSHAFLHSILCQQEKRI